MIYWFIKETEGSGKHRRKGMLVTRSDSISSVTGRRLFYAPSHDREGHPAQRTSYDKERLGVSSNPNKKRPSRQSNLIDSSLFDLLFLNEFWTPQAQIKEDLHQDRFLTRQETLVPVLVPFLSVLMASSLSHLWVVVQPLPGRAKLPAIQHYLRWHLLVLWPFESPQPWVKFRIGGGIRWCRRMAQKMRAIKYYVICQS